ncbi:MAG TPA: thiamine pyrophosphate-binding protein [Chloroflexota bacterium]|nr:thiamine pyrophosphate-binding protein [Chloroflexota bacterium]
MITVRTPRPIDAPAGIVDASGRPTWGSDLIMDVLRLLDIEYAAVLPGSTYRGIHDSAVNYTANRRPELILCNHEMITVAVAHGYAKVAGRPMAAIVHNVVGLLNTSMTIYNAWCDREPVLVLGGTGPVDPVKRRPWIDWIHTANVQGNLVRDYTKWDDQPSSLEAIPQSLLRAYRVAVTQPAGPVYVCFDVELQEKEVARPFKLPDAERYRPAAPSQPDQAALRQVARLLVGAELPLCLADRVGCRGEGVRALAALAELLAMPVVDLGARQSFPTPHPLDFAALQRELLREADVVLGLDVVDLEGATRLPASGGDGATPGAQARSQKVISISQDELIHRGTTADYQALPAVDLPVLGDGGLALPLLIEECRALLDGGARGRVDRRRQALEARQDRLREQQRRYVEQQWDHPQITETRLVAELWQAVKGEEFVFTNGRLRRMAPGVCEIPGPDSNVGSGGAGGAVGSATGVALGSALALKDSGKLPVAILGDGEFLASIQALWTAAHYRIPSLWVINNNRSYFNDEDHQDRVAKMRDRPPENRWIAQRLENPEVDFAAITRTFGLAGEGPIKSAADLGPALSRAVEAVKRGQLAVVDVWTENRSAG